MSASIRILPFAARVAVAALFFCGPRAPAGELSFAAEPDTIVLRGGAEMRGLIVRNTPFSLTIQTANGEETYRKSEIARIRDADGEGEYLTNAMRKGSLPPWRTLVNDLRHNDGVRSFEQIPATVVEIGDFKNVPYLSFRLNRSVEMNIYGDPEDPAGIEIGIYGLMATDRGQRKLAREFLASYLNTRAEIAALYHLDENGAKCDVGSMTIEYTAPGAPDAEGAWWLSVYNRRALKAARLDDREYARLTRPASEVHDAKGGIRDTAWTRRDEGQSLRLKRDRGQSERLFVRGFYRDKDGTFRLVTAP